MTLQEITFLKVLNDGSHVIYHPSGQDDKGLVFIQFYVSSDGDMFVLATDDKEELFLLKAGDDPSSFAATKLDQIQGAGPYTIKSFIVLPNGSLMLYGYFDDKAAKGDRGDAYLVELDPSGKVLRKTSERTGESELKSAVEQGGAAPVLGRDGLVYFLAQSRILGINQDGELVRKIDLNPPEPGYRAWQLNSSGGRLLVNFMKVPKGKKLMLSLYVLIDSSTGAPLRTYRPSPELGNVLTCFSDDGLTFYRVNKAGNAELVTAPAN